MYMNFCGWWASVQTFWKNHTKRAVRGFSLVANESHLEETAAFDTSGANSHMSPVSLATLRKGARGVVVSVRDEAQSLGDEAQSTISRRMLELGFVSGEPIEVIEEVWPSGDPIAVRLGNTTFALRRREASVVLVEPEAAG